MTNVDIMDSTVTDIPAFTPSLGLRYWMNKMRRTSTKAGKKSPSPLPQATALPAKIDRQTNDAHSAVSISGITTSSYFGMGSCNGYDIDSSLRVHHQASSSERSSFLSDDIQSNASIKSKPWISRLVTNYHNNNNTNNNSHHYADIAGTTNSNSSIASTKIDNNNKVPLSAVSITSPNTFYEANEFFITKSPEGEGIQNDNEREDDGEDADENQSTGYTSSLSGNQRLSSMHSNDLSVSDNVSSKDTPSQQQQQKQQQPQQKQQQPQQKHKQQQQPQQQQQQQRRYSENDYSPHPLGRIKAGLGRLIMGREHSSASEQRSTLL